MCEVPAQQGFDWARPDLPRLASWPPGLDGLAPAWQTLVRSFLESAAGQGLSARLHEALAAGLTLYPPEPFRALQLTAPADVRVVILGQDPYHGPGQAQAALQLLEDVAQARRHLDCGCH